MNLQGSMGYHLVVLIISILNLNRLVKSQCSLPTTLITTWRDGLTGLDTTISNTGLTWHVSAWGTAITDWECLHYRNDVIVWRTRNTYTPPSKSAIYLYGCMMIKQHSSSLYYYYLLNDENKRVDGNDRLIEDSREDLTMCQACRNTTGRSTNDFYVLNSGGSNTAKSQITSPMFSTYTCEAPTTTEGPISGAYGLQLCHWIVLVPFIYSVATIMSFHNIAA